ncbi:Tyrosine recombinase XerC [compost metagenome]
MISICIDNGRCKSKDSWETYGRNLFDFLNFCEANSLDWRDNKRYRDLCLPALYRDWSFYDCGLDVATVGARVNIVTRYYEYALKQGWISKLPFSYNEVKVIKPADMLAHTDTSGGVALSSEVQVRKKRTRIDVLATSQVVDLLKALKNKTHSLITRMGLEVGLRKREILTFPVSYVVDPDAKSNRRSFYPVVLNPRDMKTKGDKSRKVYIPRELMAELWQYVKFERGERSCKSSVVSDVLFLNSSGKPWSNNGRGLNKVYEKLRLGFKVRPHMLRHTYATTTLFVLRKINPPFDPLIFLQDRLGHEFIETTMIYLHFLDTVQEEYLEEYFRSSMQMLKDAA